MFRVTPAAAEQVRSAAAQGGAEGMALRLAAARQNDGSFEYQMGFDAPREEDIRLNSEGVEVVMEPEYVPLLDETVLDYVELEQGEFQFIFLNPKDPSYQPPDDQAAPPKVSG
ncbi:MAG: iron-sulfur cluster assembly accessory protein [Chromatiales bacterium]|jgi:iron-sulfur cluster assembly protein